VATISVNASATLSGRGRTTSSGTITWTAPALPDDATVTGISVSGTWSWTGKGSISRVTINGTNTSGDYPFDVSLGASATSPLSISCVGNKKATGSYFSWSDLQVTYTYTVPSTAPPVITVGSPDREIISDENGYNECLCTFIADTDLQAWEARATKAGVTPGRGVGLLVESGGALEAGAAGTVSVVDAELTDGDGDYTITVYGQSTGGTWSE
jgi:hypothetical protein